MLYSLNTIFLFIIAVQQVNADFANLLSISERIFFPHRQLITHHLKNWTNSDKSLFSEKCRHSLHQLRIGLELHHLWAMRYIDASGKGSPGLTNYYLSDLGNYDQCLSLGSPPESTVDTFYGQYCIAAIKLPPMVKYGEEDRYREHLEVIDWNNTLVDFFRLSKEQLQLSTLQIAVCMPSTCTANEIEFVVNQQLESSGLSIKFNEYCDTNEKIWEDRLSFNLIEIFAFLVFGVCWSLVWLGTFIDRGFLRHFSLVRNTQRMFHTGQSSSNSSVPHLSFIHGAKAYYLPLSIFGHACYIMGTMMPSLYMGIYSYSISDNWLIKEFSSNSLLLIETIIFLGGLLTIYTWYPVIQKCNGRLSFFKYTILRYFRMVPTLIGVLLFSFVWPKFGSGPYFRQIAASYKDKCLKNWWRNLLFINNYQGVLDQCIPSTWYLAADFQLYLISYPPVILLCKRPKLGLFVTCMYIVLSGLYMMYDADKRNLPAVIDIRIVSKSNIDSILDLYFPFHLHIQSYMMGILSGYFIVTRKQIAMPGFFTIGWILNITISPFIFVLTYMMKFSPFITRTHQLLFIGFHRLPTVSYFAWASYAVAMGSWRLSKACYHEWMNIFFGYKIMAFISNMSLSVVLVQFPLMFYDLGVKRRPLVFTHYDQMMYASLTISTTLVTAYFFHILFEAPFTNVLRSFIISKSKLTPIKAKKTIAKCSTDDDLRPLTPPKKLNYNNNIGENKKKL